MTSTQQASSTSSGSRPRRRRSSRASNFAWRIPAARAAVLAFPLLALCGLPVLLVGTRSRFGLGVTVALSQTPTITGSLRNTAGGAAAAAAVAAAAAGSGSGAAAAAAAVATQGSSVGGNSSESSDGYSALCVVGRNENPYIREWVEYHQCLGFSRIYLYDHNSSVPLINEISDYVNSGFVVYTNFSAAHTKYKDGYTSDLDRFMSTVQGQAYKDCVTRHSGRHTFLGFIDVDEFLVIYDKTINNVDELLQQYEQHPGLSVYWVLLGSSGHRERPAGLVVDEYKACTPHDHKFNTQFKTFANTRFRPVMYSPHRAVFAAPPDPTTGLEPYMVDETHTRVPRGRNKASTHTRAAVYHYVTKSLVDFTEKQNRGGGAGVTRPTYYFDLMNKYSKETCDGAVVTRQRFCGGKRPQPLSKLAGGREAAPAIVPASGVDAAANGALAKGAAAEAGSGAGRSSAAAVATGVGAAADAASGKGENDGKRKGGKSESGGPAAAGAGVAASVGATKSAAAAGGEAAVDGSSADLEAAVGPGSAAVEARAAV